MKDVMRRNWQDISTLFLLLYLVAGFLIMQGKAQELESEPPTLEKQRRVVTDLVYRVQDVKGRLTEIKAKMQDLQVRETATDIRIALNADILFDFDKAEILPKAQTALRQAAALIQQRTSNKKQIGVRIEGHTDAIGSHDYNRKLSERRAQAVMSWLAKLDGMTTVIFTTDGCGATKPVAANKNPDGSDNPEGRRQNRRVEVIIKK